MADYTLSARVTGDASSFNKMIDGAKSKLDTLSSKVSSAGSSISGFGAKTAALGAGMTAAITMPFAKAVKSTADFEQSMNKAALIADGSRENLDKMKQSAFQLAADFPVNAQEVADAMQEMAAKGYDSNQIIDMMPGVLSAAAASGEDLAVVSDTVSSALNGFGLEAKDASKVADLLTGTANASAAGVADMGNVFKYAAPAAHNLGISMEDLATVSGIMMNKGLEASQVGTTMRMGLQRLVKPTKASAEAMEGLGFSAVDGAGKFKDLRTIIGELGQSMESYTPAQKTAALATIFGTEAASGMAMLLAEGVDGYDKMNASIEKNSDASKTAAEMQKHYPLLPKQ